MDFLVFDIHKSLKQPNVGMSCWQSINPSEFLDFASRAKRRRHCPVVLANLVGRVAQFGVRRPSPKLDLGDQGRATQTTSALPE